jgi:hypothetical protein
MGLEGTLRADSDFAAKAGARRRSLEDFQKLRGTLCVIIREYRTMVIAQSRLTRTLDPR